MNTPSRKPSVKLVHGKATTTSLIVAKSFGKQHYNVIRTIQNLECSPEFSALNFELAGYTDAQGKKRPMYIITRKGFSFLACKFTGKEAAQWTEKFIEAFDQLEQHALEKAAAKRAPPALPPAPRALPAITGERQTRINQRAWALTRVAYEQFRDAMMEDVMVMAGHTNPEDWQPLETRKDVLELIYCAARGMESYANSIHRRGHRLARMVGEDYVKTTAKFRPAKEH
ncbi:MAG TPA: Rha family transcriptional regulator [Gallionella sp.]